METEVRKVEMSENVADPTGLGLLGLAVVCFVVSTSRVGWSSPLWLASGSSKWGPLAQRYRKALM